jgi:hypothetical protein
LNTVADATGASNNQRMSASRRDSRDAIAREAARLLALGRAADIDEAVSLARQKAAASGGSGGQPSRMLVRKHAQAMSMQSMGEAAYRARARGMLAMAEEIMTALQQSFPEAQTLLVGRAAAAGGGHFDADPSIHIRVLIDATTTQIAAALAMLGYDDIEFVFTTLETAREGPLSQIEWTEAEVRVILTCCPNRRVFERRSDLVTAKRLPTLTLEALRKELEHDANDDNESS